MLTKIEKTLKYIRDRARLDSKPAFAARIARQLVVCAYTPGRWVRAKVAAGRVKDTPCDVLNFKMYLDHKGTGICRDLLLDHVREPIIGPAYIGMLRPEDVVYDIGANIGYYVIQEARHAAFVYAIEPVQHNLELLEKNVRLNKLTNVGIMDVAVGDYNGQATMKLADKWNHCSIENDYSTNIGQAQVEVRTLDNIVRPRHWPSVIKMDVEGYEYRILRGMKDILECGRPLMMFIEVHFNILGKERSMEVLQTLEDAGMKVIYATYECHTTVRGHRLGEKLLSLCERQMGLEHGVAALKLQDLYEKVFINGQVSNLELVLGRGFC